MKLIDKWWKRLLISLFGVAFIIEMIHMKTGVDVGRLTFIGSIIVYLFLSFWYGFFARKRRNKEKFVVKE